MKKVILPACMSLALAGCINPNEAAMELGKPPDFTETGGPSSLAFRALETRRYEAPSERALLVAATQTLQDLGFTITESSLDAGVLVGSKTRDAEEEGQVTGAIAATILVALLGGQPGQPTWDKEQTIWVTFTTTPIKNSKQVEARVFFDRKLVNNQGQLWRAEIIHDKSIYQEFFEKLSKGNFLEVHSR